MSTQDISKIHNFYEHYNKHDLDSLSNALNNTDERINFEKWLTSHIGPNRTADFDPAWHTRVIELLCTKSEANSIGK